MKDNALFYTCSLIEHIGRKKHRDRAAVVKKLGYDNIRSIYKYSDVLHCEPIDKIADEYIHLANIYKGRYDNVGACRYTIPSYWDIGDVYSRLITDVRSEDIIQSIFDVYNSKLSEEIMDFNSALYFQPRDYLKEAYLQSTDGTKITNPQSECKEAGKAESESQCILWEER